jgi:hypothetical protein
MRLRNSLLLIILLLSTYTANSQVIIAAIFGDELNTGKIEFGLDGGFTMASMDGIEGAKPLNTWNLGFYFDIKLNNPAWMVHTGVIVKSLFGTTNAPLYPLNDSILDSAFTGGSVTKKLRYFNVPVMMKYIFANKIFVEGGTMLGLLRRGASDIFVNTVQKEDDLSYKLDVTKSLHRLDVGLMVGVGYRLKSLNLGIRYYHGLMDINVDDSIPNQYNRSLYVNIGIPIGVSDELEDEEK